MSDNQDYESREKRESDLTHISEFLKEALSSFKPVAEDKESREETIRSKGGCYDKRGR